MTLYQRKPGAPYTVILWDPVRRKRVWKSTHTTNEKDAGDLEAKYRLEMRQLAAPTLPGAKEIPWGTFYEEYLRISKPDKKARVQQFDREVIERRFMRHYNPQTSFDLTPARLEDWKAILHGKGLKAGSINRYLGPMKSLAKWGVKRRFIPFTEAEFNGVDYLPPGQTPVRPFSLKEVNLILAAAQSDANFNEKLFLMICFQTGMRAGEIQNLEFSDVDFDLKIIKVQQKSDWTPKSYKSRWIPLSKSLRREIMLEKSKNISSYVLTYKGQKTKEKYLNKKFRRILRRLKDNTGRYLIAGTFGIHRARHTWITQLQMMGVSPVLVQKWAGHSNRRLTEDTYTHVNPTPDFRQVDRLPFRAIKGAINKVGKLGYSGKVDTSE